MAAPSSSGRAIIQRAQPQIAAAMKSKAIHGERDRTNVPITCVIRKKTAAAVSTTRIIVSASRESVSMARRTLWTPTVTAGATMMPKQTTTSTVAAMSLPNQIAGAGTGFAK